MKTVLASRLPRSSGEHLAAACGDLAHLDLVFAWLESHEGVRRKSIARRGEGKCKGPGVEAQHPWHSPSTSGCSGWEERSEGVGRHSRTRRQRGQGDRGRRPSWFLWDNTHFSHSRGHIISTYEALVIIVVVKEYSSCSIASSNFEIKSVSKTNSSEG